MSRWVAVLLLAVAGGPAAADETNRVRNPGFEQLGEAGLPVGWRWAAGRTEATFAADREVAHSGRQSLRLEHPTPKSHNVYALLEQQVSVRPETEYTLSAFVRGGRAGAAWLGGGPGWKVRQPLPAGPDWQRVVVTFTTGPGERLWQLLILTEDTAPSWWIDDIQLEPGPVATAFEPEPVLAPGELALRVTAEAAGVNLLPNASFESVRDGQPVGWIWERRQTDATCAPDAPGRSGARALRFTNGTAFGPHVYGLLRLADELPVEPRTVYTLSYWCRTTGRPGLAWVGGGTGWKVRLTVPQTDGQWRRVSTSFTTGPEDHTIPVVIVTESPTAPFWIDDVQIEAGGLLTSFEAPDTELPAQVSIGQGTPGGLAPAPWKPERYPAEQWAFCDQELVLDGLFSQPAETPSRLTLRLRAGADELAVATADGLSQRARLRARWRLPAETPESLTVEATAQPEGGAALRESVTFRLVTAAQVAARLTALEADLPALRARAEADDQVRVTATVVENFIGFARDDLAGGAVLRAWDTALELEAVRDAARVRPPGPQAPRYVTSPLTIAGSSFLGQARLPDGREVRRPIQFTGYGHFGQVRRDVEKFPGYGHNLIQIEFGPRSVLVAEGQTSTQAIDDFLAVCDRAARANVAVNLLLSPHYFPDWALQKWPDLKEFEGGFLKFCVYDPRARGIVEEYLRFVIPKIRDHPALHSLCLTNEPVSVDLSRSPAAAELWHDWLAARFATVEALNRRWGTDYAAVDAILVPAPSLEPSALLYDFTVFNQEIFADWHRWMADIIHELAPGLPVHAKIMMGAHFKHHFHADWSIAPELFGEFSQISGNDAVKWPASADWACSWVGENAGYDYQRSSLDAPVFNSENHLIVDRDASVVEPAFIRNVYWQGAIHGQSATTTWVWERTLDAQSSFAGSILHRPECVEAAGRTALDLNRLSPEIAALQEAPAPVAILWSQASSTWRGDAHGRDVLRAYTTANFAGVPVGFVNERDAARYAAGETPRAWQAARVLVLAGADYLPAGTIAAVSRFAAAGGRVLRLGDCGTHDETGQPRAALAVGEAGAVPATRAEQEALAGRLRQVLAEVGAAPRWEAGVFGVESRCAPHEGRLIVNLTDYLTQEAAVSLGAGWTDLMTGQPAPETLTLAPLEVRMVARAVAAGGEG